MKGNPINKRLQKGILSVLLPAFAFSGGPVQANPQGGVVVRGAADIRAISANQMRIHQQTPMAVINWQDFSIGAGQTTRFVQPTNGTVLNRVTSGNISQIHGQLKANANVYVVNRNGIVVGSSGVIDVGGRMVMSTLDIDDDDFMAGGPDRFHGDSNTGVTNFGTISSSGGDVVLLGGFVDNQGQIGALNGTVAIGSGGDILLQEGAGAKISVRGSSDYTGTGINNSGTIRGASAELKAHGNVYALAINNGGAIRATGADRSSGRVLLRASGSSSNINLGARSTVAATAGADGGTIEIDAGQGKVDVAGQIDARGTHTGGAVSVVGNQILQAPESVVDATGRQAGGSVSMDATGAAVLAGTVRTESANGAGGDVKVTGQTVLISDSARVSATGHAAGGRIRVGGDFQGRDTGMREADSTWVEEGARLTADSLAGRAGTVIVWANHDTLFLGEASASALGNSGDGGLVEISGKEHLYFDGVVRAGSVGGKAGTVLFDPGDVVIGATGGPPPLVSPVTASQISIAAVNDTLQGGTNVLVATHSGSILIQDLGGGGVDLSGATAGNRHAAIQWTNSLASFGAFASGSIIVQNHIRTSGAGSINLLAGWTGNESDAYLALAPQDAWDYYMQTGAFGSNGGSVIVGNNAMNRHVEVGSRFGDTNVAGADVFVIGSDTNSVLRYSMIGFHDGGQIFGPRLNRGGNFRLDLKVGAASGTGQWYLSDGLNGAGQAANGVGDPIVGIAGRYEVDVNGDGIMDGVRGINSTGVLDDTFIPYASHFNSALTGNWWWQQIEDAGSLATKDPMGLGGLRPEYGAGVGQHSAAALALGAPVKGANINVIARGSVVLQGGSGSEEASASIGHGGPNRGNWGGGGTSVREIGNESADSPFFSIRSDANQAVTQIIEGDQIERRWSFNGSTSDRNATAIGRLAPVYGNINVLAGVAEGATVDRAAGTVSASHRTSGHVILRGGQLLDGTATHYSPTLIGHGGTGQFGEFYGDIHVAAGHSVIVDAGEGTYSGSAIGHTFVINSYWNPTSVKDQQIRFFATTGDFDNPNLRRGQLFSSGVPSTGFDPGLDPAAQLRYTLGNGYAYQDAGGNWQFVGHTPGSGNFVEVRGGTDGTGAPTGKYVNFNNVGGNTDQRVINMSPLLYTQGLATAGIHSSGAASQGRTTLAPLTLSPVSTAPDGGLVVEALDGAIVNGFHGNITVTAHHGDISLNAYNSQASTALTRDSRFAAIGHGGRGTDTQVLGSGFRTMKTVPSIPGMSGGAITGNVDAREFVNLGFAAGDEYNSGSLSELTVSNVGRYGLLNMSMTGDIDVHAGRDVTLTGGNEPWDHTRIGHGGLHVADYETSSFILGDIRVRAGGNLSLNGGGVVTNLIRAGSFTTGAWAQVGHGGYRTGFFGFLGDILVETGRDVVLTGGPYRWTHAMIGHQGVESYGQSGGDFVRNEHFTADGVWGTIQTRLFEGQAVVNYNSPFADGATGSRDFASNGAGTLVGGGLNTANIAVTAGGGVTLTHLQEGVRQPAGRLGTPGNPNSQTEGIRTHDSFALIGHGGHTAHTFVSTNSSSNYVAKVGDISVSAQGGNVNLENGTGEHRWARIGHALGSQNRVDDGTDIGMDRAVRMAGNIRVTASGDILVNADAANENERQENFDALAGSPNPSRWNPVAIGHGGVINNLDLVVLGRGEMVNGIAASSNIDVAANGNVYVLGGKGVEASFAQIGHGFASDMGDDASRLRGEPTGFAGNISVVVGGNLIVRGNDNAWSDQPGSDGTTAQIVTGAFAAIGHGGYQLDAPSFGDISVYVGNDLSIVAQRRTDATMRDSQTGASPYTLINQETEAVASGFNFAKIGHFSAENGNRGRQGTGTPPPDPSYNDEVRDAHQTGDITVVVGRDLLMTGGTTPNVDTQTIYGAFVQIGHGGPSITGDLKGDIVVLVKRDATVRGGTDVGDAGTVLTTKALNNYAMIGHGDRIYDADGSITSTFNGGGGFRDGNIILAAGRHATFNRSLVGHVDPRIATPDQPSFGNTQVAVSRTNPFFGGGGTLTATRGSVFSSGDAGNGSRLEFYIPSRSSNLMDATTRLNERTATFAVAPADFAAPFNRSNGYLAGRADEVYLTPDLWWDQTGRAASELGIPGAGVFPTDALSGQGGAIALVESPGGIYNLESLVAGALGSSAPVYRDGNGVSGSGSYTLYYDAIEFVRNAPPTPPQQPGVPTIPIPGGIYDPDFNFGGLLFGETYDAFFREEGLGDWLYPLLGLFERDEETQEESGAWRLENALDDLFGERRDSTSQEEDDEDERRRRARGRAEGQVGMTYYIYEPGTNRYSSYRVFGNQLTSFYPVN